ncbi:MAG: flagellar biosynthesis protein FlhF [Roseburia sp.]|nr:flagellar biosynthesis protein FlhF [Roseburia sp.]
MIIKKFQGKTKEEALESARKELGDGIVEMNVKTVKAKGVLGVFKGTKIEVTVAKEEENERYGILPKEEKKLINPPVEKPVDKLVLPSEPEKDGDGLGEKLDTLQTLIEQQISQQQQTARQQEAAPMTEESSKPEEPEKKEETKENKARVNFLRLLYNKMIDNEINEKYANEIIDEIDRNCKPDVTLDYMLSEIYQRMILKLGKPYMMREAEHGPKVVFFVGPTGVGKTTTIAKIASSFRVERKKKVALLTADTYRIAAAEQLRTYANILEVPFRVVYTEKEILGTIEEFREYDYILVDTTGHSPNNEAQCENMSDLINSVDAVAEKEVFLVLSASTKYRDLMKTADIYKEIAEYKLIFTKLDETATMGNIYNLRIYTGAALSYVTCGQSVPDDIEYFNPQSTVKQLLGGRR